MSRLVAFHGFVGRAQDWDSLQRALPEHECEAYDWFGTLNDFGSLERTAQHYNHVFQQADDVLIGYSMGGRLALHMLLSPNSPWKRAIIISTSPGIKDPVERQSRLARDHQWAAELLSTHFSAWIQKWNEQTIFQSDPEPDRSSWASQTVLLAEALMKGSVGGQRDLMPRMSQISARLLWVAGESDPSYVERLRDIEALHFQKIETATIKSGGHRLIFSNADALAQRITLFLNNSSK